MKNHIYLDGKKIAISEETANNLRGAPRANKGENYYYVGLYAKVKSLIDDRDKFDTKMYESGNYFLKEKDTEKVAKKFRKILKEK